jgi:deoxyribose-phosphate aldolase
MTDHEIAQLVEQLTREATSRAEAQQPGDEQATRTIARYIDHTLLKPDATQAQIEKLCAEAREYHFFSVCVNPSWVPLCADLLQGSDVQVCTVIGFPLGATTTESKVFETDQACRAGASEVDMVLNIAALKGGTLERAADDIRAVAATAHQHGALLKVIIETVLLTDREKVEATTITKAAGADFVKTSTGFAGGGATVPDVALMRHLVGPDFGVKASGGVRNLKDALQMIRAGANRIGASAGVAIVKEASGSTPAPSSGQGY